MKKILLGTTAVVALGTMTTEAFAADKIALGLGGFMRHYVGLSNNDEVATTSNSARDKDIGQFSNTEIYFTGSTTLDNGLKVAVRHEYEADGAANQNADKNWLSIGSDAMGTVTIGSATHFADDNKVRVPNAGNFDWTDTDPWAGVSTASANDSTVFTPSSLDISDNGGDSVKLKYNSPSFSGVTVGVSYTAAETGSAHNARRVTENSQGVTTGISQDGYSFGAAYSGEMSGAAIGVSLTHQNTADSVESNHVGASVGMSGFTVGGGYSDFSDTRIGRSDNDGKSWELGVSYETGPVSVSAGYMNADNKGLAATAGSNEDTKWNVSATYDLGAGVALTGTYFNSEANGEGAGATTKTSVSGVIAGIEVGF